MAKNEDGKKSITGYASQETLEILNLECGFRQCKKANLITEIVEEWAMVRRAEIYTKMGAEGTSNERVASQRQKDYIVSLSEKTGKAVPKTLETMTVPEADKTIKELLKTLE